MTNSEVPHSSVTRVEVIDLLERAFSSAPLSRDQLIGAAKSNGADLPMLDLLAQLPERAYRRPADMWDELPGVPIER
ncbi:MAG TPA: DUF2795 domain-containing protein [Ilumatobacter sp.]|nr:DUF2795 domain-containing protein [Ilumatobacter sp.]